MKFDVFDLDGTIFPGNTFHHFSLFVFRHSISRADFKTGAQASRLLILRACKQISHFEWKRRLMELTKEIPAGAISEFAKRVAAKARPRLERILEDQVNLRPRILATAAPDIYAEVLGPMLGFSHVVASKLIRSELREANKEWKKELVLAYSASEKMGIGRFYTDHHDDIPLAAISERCVLINPSEKTVVRFQTALVPFELMHL